MTEGRYRRAPRAESGGGRAGEVEMRRDASFHSASPKNPHDRRGIAWASIIAILFIVAAAISFAVDQSVTLSNFPAPPTRSAGR
jgi:hypothetical protein